MATFSFLTLELVKCPVGICPTIARQDRGQPNSRGEEPGLVPGHAGRDRRGEAGEGGQLGRRGARSTATNHPGQRSFKEGRSVMRFVSLMSQPRGVRAKDRDIRQLAIGPTIFIYPRS